MGNISVTTVSRSGMECLFELAPIGPRDVLARCGEAASGNWWGAEECLRVDKQGRVVLVDPDIYFEVRYVVCTWTRACYYGTAAAAAMDGTL